MRYLLYLLVLLSLAACGQKESYPVALPQEYVTTALVVDPALTPLGETAEQLAWTAIASLMQTDTAQASQLATALSAGWLSAKSVDMRKPVILGNLLVDFTAQRNLAVIHIHVGDEQALAAALKKAFPQGESFEQDCVKGLRVPGAVLLWDAQALVLLPQDARYTSMAEGYIAAAMPCQGSPKPTLAQIPTFAQLLADVPGKSRISLFGGYHAVGSVVPESMLNLVGLEKKDITDNYIISHLKTQDNRFYFDVEFMWSPGLRNYFKPMSGAALGQEVLRNMPADSVFALAGYSLHLENLVANIQKPMSRIPAMGMAGQEIDKLEGTLGMHPRKLLDIFNGKVLVVLKDMAGDIEEAAAAKSGDAFFGQLQLSGMVGLGVQDSAAAWRLIRTLASKGEMKLMPTANGLLRLAPAQPAGAPATQLYLAYAQGYIWIGNTPGIMRTLRQGLPATARRLPERIVASGRGNLTLYNNMDPATLPPGMAQRQGLVQVLKETQAHYLFGEASEKGGISGLVFAADKIDLVVAVRRYAALNRYFTANMLGMLQRLQQQRNNPPTRVDA